MANQSNDPEGDLRSSDTTKRFTDTMRRLLTVPKEDIARREEEYRKAHPKKAKPKKGAA